MIKQEWDKAPVDPSLDGRKLKIPRFVVPLEEEGRAVTESLLGQHGRRGLPDQQHCGDPL
jgi:hypothetical protein